MSRPARIALAAAALVAGVGLLWLLGVVAPTRAEDRVAPLGAALGDPALAALDGVALGMSPRALRGARAVEPAPYVGLGETVGGARVAYRFAGDFTRVAGLWMDEDGRVPPWMRLAAVEAWTELASTAAADSLWQAAAVSLARSAPGEVRCFAYEQGMTSAIAALRESGGRAVGVVRYPQRAERDVRGPLTIAAGVRAFVARDVGIVVPAHAERRPMPCPAAP